MFRRVERDGGRAAVTVVQRAAFGQNRLRALRDAGLRLAVRLRGSGQGKEQQRHARQQRPPDCRYSFH